MDALSEEDVINLSLSVREERHQSNTRIGYHVFLSRFFLDFKDRPRDVQQGLVAHLVSRYDSDEDSVNSLDSEEGIKVTMIIKLASTRWNNFDLSLREAWQRRAEQLNAMPRPGKFVCLNDFHIGTDDILQSLTVEWRRFVGVLRSAIVRPPKNPHQKLEVSFGKERVTIHSQSYRTFDISLLLQLCIFGKQFEKLCAHEIIAKTKKTVLIHIESASRMRELFSLCGLCGVTYNENGREMSCSGKVETVTQDGKQCLGYILDNVGDHYWKVKLMSNQLVTLQKPFFNRDTREYLFNENNGGAVNGIRIQAYWPIRLLIFTSGHGKLTLNRVTHRSDNNAIIIQQCS
jgi:hypothetical protein